MFARFQGPAYCQSGLVYSLATQVFEILHITF